MTSITLTAEEQALQTQIEAQLKDIWEKHNKRIDVRLLLNVLAAQCHALHMSLKSRGLEPRHNKYMYQNRGVPPTDVEFYRHIHPAEALLKFINDTSANDDPIDSTMGHEFDFNVFSRRWGYRDTFRLTRNPQGWHVAFMNSGQSDKDGRPHLFELLDGENINYPRALPGYFGWLWDCAKENGLSHEEVQNAINELADWVSECERTSPAGVFDAFK
ncbi:hypothetical protein [Polyangium fumosum]|uniref:Uncharacterized protein n=1 Tax=Polyangium fumosum TaxID=889272 RepID=A0A4U1IW86_9BACT|nr:hypothetical protein [Polyangium fumosum]TKC98285.1 hypothetical protein E8A74_41675 [Polyangium fumosum]